MELKYQKLEKIDDNKVIVKVIDGPETPEQCVNDLEIVYNKYGEVTGLRTRLY